MLDEADEMLRMGFIDDVTWILEQTPPSRQIALFSATMPTEIRKIANRYLNQPEQVTIKVRTTTAETIRQRYWMVSGVHKLDALTRMLEAETFDGVIIFVRTKTATVELAEKLEARGYACAPLNGDIAQKQREYTVDRLKSGKLDILIATDVAARGLDVERVSHVINYDIPYDAEAYTHRIGRTGRAGRKGDAILFVSPREKRLLRIIEKATRQKIELMELPSTEIINNARIARFNQRITDTLAEEDLSFFHQLMEQYEFEHNVPGLEIAAALAKIVQGDQPLLLQNQKPERKRAERQPREERSDKPNQRRERRPLDAASEDMELFRIEVGHDHDVQPGNIVGAISNEAGLESQYIGRIDIRDNHSIVELPEGMPKDVFRHLKKVWVSGRQLNITRLNAEDETSERRPARKPKTAKRKPARTKAKSAAGKKPRTKTSKPPKRKKAATSRKPKA